MRRRVREETRERDAPISKRDECWYTVDRVRSVVQSMYSFAPWLSANRASASIRGHEFATRLTELEVVVIDELPDCSVDRQVAPTRVSSWLIGKPRSDRSMSDCNGEEVSPQGSASERENGLTH